MGLDTIINISDASVYQKTILILSGVTLSIDKGEFVYLIGKTGAGKSSLLKTIYAELPLLEGEAEVAGFNLKNIRNRDIPYLRRKLGIVFQDFQLLNDRSVNDNLMFVMRATGWKDHDAMRHRMNEVLDKVGLITKGFKMPHQLSGGEQQRVSIARALINDPELLFLDEDAQGLQHPLPGLHVHRLRVRDDPIEIEDHGLERHNSLRFISTTGTCPRSCRR